MAIWQMRCLLPKPIILIEKNELRLYMVEAQILVWNQMGA